MSTVQTTSAKSPFCFRKPFILEYVYTYSKCFKILWADSCNLTNIKIVIFFLKKKQAHIKEA